LYRTPETRLERLNSSSVNPDGAFILYWMTTNRRIKWNYSLDRVIEWAQKLNKPVVVLEPLDCAYEWASERFHGFILQGMKENYREAHGKNILYYPYVEPEKGKGSGLVLELAKQSCLVVTDDLPTFFIPAMLKKISDRLPVLIEKVDSNGLLPMSKAGREFTTAYSFRRFLQKTLPGFIMEHPCNSPLDNLSIPVLKKLPNAILKRWPPVSISFLEGCQTEIKKLPIDHGVEMIIGAGGYNRGSELLDLFINDKLPFYDEKRNLPEEDATSNLSPYLHFGHISAHEIFHRLQQKEKWHPGRLSDRSMGHKEGWWGMGNSAEAFLDQLITWRELGFNMCRYNKDYEKFKSLPGWAKQTLKTHEMDNREYIYSEEEFEKARTHDLLWNAAQVQLVREGKIHNYLRMLWGKKILEWSPSPESALKTMLHLNNKYALDGRDPNSYSGIFWILGRYDRAWGPEREIFGKVRYMSSANTARKVKVVGYIKRYS
jgi:deoxyribodipyrimidine photo-lyase